MNSKAFLNVLLSTAITLILLSALLFYVLSHPRESASNAYAIGEQTAKAIAETPKESLKRLPESNKSNATSQEKSSPQKEPKESFSIVGRTILD